MTNLINFQPKMLVGMWHYCDSCEWWATELEAVVRVGETEVITHCPNCDSVLDSDEILPDTWFLGGCR